MDKFLTFLSYAMGVGCWLMALFGIGFAIYTKATLFEWLVYIFCILSVVVSGVSFWVGGRTLAAISK